MLGFLICYQTKQAYPVSQVVILMVMGEKMISELLEKAQEVLKRNDRGTWTVPASDLYPHQWLWDSCFIAIGRRHINIKRAQTELESLLRGQWDNGMLAHIIFAPGDNYSRDRDLWNSRVNSQAPRAIATSGLTQPPMMAEAVIRIGEKLEPTERRDWYKKLLPALIKYHQWLYGERDPHESGLITVVHPYETGLDDSPPWIISIRRYCWPWWVRLAGVLNTEWLFNLFRRDTGRIPAGQRMSNIESLAYWYSISRLRRLAYDSRRILKHEKLLVEDLAFNCIAIRANAHLRSIADEAGQKIPEKLSSNMKNAETALENLWDDNSNCYFSRDVTSKQLIKEPTIAALLPLYTGCISRQRAERLVVLLRDRDFFKLPYPISSLPKTSSYFNPQKYWQGPSWLNTNWLIIDGLMRYGYRVEAEHIKTASLELVAKNGPREYFNPITARGLGAANFSWTAALTIDLLKTN